MRTVSAVLLLLVAWPAIGQSPARAPLGYEANWASLDSRPIPAWFEEARFGIFVCWGPYSVPAWAPKGAYAEWYGHEIRNPDTPQARFHARVYGKDFPYTRFGPMLTGEMFDADAWAELFARSGARYAIMAANYHDGFSLWPNPYAPGWNAMEVGPKRDVLGEFTAAVRKRGLKAGIYFSLYEWYHPLWLSDRQRYVSEHFHPQFRDVVNRYRPSVIFADGEWEADDKVWSSEELLGWLFNESPARIDVVVNDRWGNSRGKHGSFYESEYGGGNMAPTHPWQEDRGIGKSYGYNRNEDIGDYDCAVDLIRMLCRCAGNGGNLLLDVGPEADGRIPVIMQERLLQIGDWLRVNGESIYGSKASPFWPRAFAWGTVTQKPGRIFLHLYKRPSGAVALRGLRNRLEGAWFLSDPGHARLPVRQTAEGPEISLPGRLPDAAVSVIEVQIEGTPRVDLTLRQRRDRSVQLTAADATIHGASPRLEYRASAGNIGFWQHPTDSVGWTFRCELPGAFDVVLRYACATGAGGSAFVVGVASQEIRARTVETGSWDRFAPHALGRVRLPGQGTYTLTIRPATPPAWKSMGLESVLLVPAR